MVQNFYPLISGGILSKTWIVIVCAVWLTVDSLANIKDLIDHDYRQFYLVSLLVRIKRFDLFDPNPF